MLSDMPRGATEHAGHRGVQQRRQCTIKHERHGAGSSKAFRQPGAPPRCGGPARCHAPLRPQQAQQACHASASGRQARRRLHARLVSNAGKVKAAGSPGRQLSRAFSNAQAAAAAKLAPGPLQRTNDLHARPLQDLAVHAVEPLHLSGLQHKVIQLHQNSWFATRLYTLEGRSTSAACACQH